MNPTPPITPPATPPPVPQAQNGWGGSFNQNPWMKPLVFLGVGLLGGYLWANYRAKKNADKAADEIAKQVVKDFGDMMDKAIAGGAQSLSSFRDEWNKQLNAAG